MRYLFDLHHGFGDVLHMVPAIRTIQQNDQEAEISILMSTQANIDLYRTQNLADEYILLKSDELFKYRIGRVLKPFDFGIVAPCIIDQRKAHLLLKMFGCRNIIKEEESVRTERKHRVDKNISLIEKLGFKTVDPYPHMFIPAEEKRFAQRELFQTEKKKKPDNIRIAICVGGNFETLKKGRQKIKIDIKRWPVEYYHKLITMLVQRYPEIDLLLIGAKKDADDFWGYKGSARIDSSCIRDYMGKTTMLQSGALIECCDFAFGNDTGMIHFAAALGRPTMTIFCATDPKKIGAYAKNAVYIEEYLPCKYCYLSEATFSCKERDCLTQIKPERAMKEIERMIYDLKSGRFGR